MLQVVLSSLSFLKIYQFFCSLLIFVNADLLYYLSYTCELQSYKLIIISGLNKKSLKNNYTTGKDTELTEQVKSPFCTIKSELYQDQLTVANRRQKTRLHANWKGLLGQTLRNFHESYLCHQTNGQIQQPKRG